MNGQYNLFNPTTSEDSPSVTSLPESESGATRSGSPGGPTKDKSGPDRAPANPSARPAKAKRSTTKGIFGQTSFDSSKHDDLSFALASRLRPLTDSLGSTLFSLTWTVRVTPAGRSISALRASEPRTEDSVCIGWPTPQLSDTTGGGQAKRSDGRANLNDFAMLSGWPTVTTNPKNQPETERGLQTLAGMARMSGWPTSRAEDAESAGMRHQRGVADTLTAAASLTGWGTPAARDWKSGDASQQTLGKNARPLNELARLAGWTTPTALDSERGGEQTENMSGSTLQQWAKMAAWPTPMAQTPAQNGNNEAGNSDSSRKTVEMCQWPIPKGWQTPHGPREHDSNVSESTYLGREAQLTAFGDQPIGFLLGPNGWEIVPASGQLNPAHSRWLMGLPKEWDDCGVTGMASLRRSRKRS